MSAAKKNLIIEQNATFHRRLIWRDAWRRAFDLTGYTAQMQIRDAAGALISDLSTENGKIAIAAASGTIDLSIAAAETAAMNFTSAAYDLYLIAPDGTRIRLLEGKVTLSIGQTA